MLECIVNLFLLKIRNLTNTLLHSSMFVATAFKALEASLCLGWKPEELKEEQWHIGCLYNVVQFICAQPNKLKECPLIQWMIELGNEKGKSESHVTTMILIDSCQSSEKVAQLTEEL